MRQLSFPLADESAPASRRAPPLASPAHDLRRGRPAVGYTDILRVERAIRSRLGPKVIVKLTENQSTMISYQERRGVLYLRLHAMFAHAPAPVLAAVAGFVCGRHYGPAEARCLDQWIEAHRPRPKPKTRKPSRPIGEIHDLSTLFDEINAAWFGGAIKARITWGDRRSHRGRRRRKSMQLGAYDEEAGEIRIHPALDQAWVPTFFVRAVVFHEMLHEKHDAPVKNGRRQVHSRAFLAEEHRYPDYRRAREWEARNLDRLLSY